jgi:hypothetical protein
MPSLSTPDPFQIWRDAISKFEDDVNALAGQGMKSPEMPQALHQFFNSMLGMRHLIEETVSLQFALLNLATRREVKEIAEALQRVEDKLDRLLPEEAEMNRQRPRRTKRPPSETAYAGEVEIGSRETANSKHTKQSGSLPTPARPRE